MRKLFSIGMVLAFVVLCLSGCCKDKNKSRNDWDKSFAELRKQEMFNPEARQASEQIPPVNILGKSYNSGPIHWLDVIFKK
jgi:hypothetical protein